MEGKGWQVSDRSDGEMISARVSARWTELTWGELVTVRFSGSYVAINCIGDPYAGRSGSRTDSSRAKTEMDLMVSALRII
jgi:hypothetical protein